MEIIIKFLLLIGFGIFLVATGFLIWILSQKGFFCSDTLKEENFPKFFSSLLGYLLIIIGGLIFAFSFSLIF